jgi:anti-anti-sigma regulatory factor
MLRIDKSQDGQKTILRLSGRIQAEDLPSLQQQLEQLDANFVLDLNDIQLVDESAVRFLAECESKGTVLHDCPNYIREWIRRVS